MLYKNYSYKKARNKSSLFIYCLRLEVLDRNDINSVRTFRTLSNAEFNLLAFS